MTHASTRSLRTTTAICAVLVLGSTPAWAQEAAPPLDTPAVSAPVAPQQPTIQLPTEAPAPPAPAAPTIVAQPVVEPVVQLPAAAPVRRTRAESRTAPRAAAAPAAAAASRSAPAPQPVAAPAPRAAEPMPPVAPVPLTEPAPVAAPAVDRPPERVSSASDTNWLLGGGIAALLLALGIGGGAYAAARARRRREAEDRWQWDDETVAAEPEQAAVEPEPFFITADPALAEAAQARRQPEFVAAEAIEPTPHPSAAQRIGSEELAPAAFVMPSGPVPQTREERDALLEQMADAPPDAENPFTSRKARLRRARIILQSLEHEQEQAASQPFDWRTYKPSTSHPAPATPERVTV